MDTNRNHCDGSNLVILDPLGHYPASIPQIIKLRRHCRASAHMIYKIFHLDNANSPELQRIHMCCLFSIELI